MKFYVVGGNRNLDLIDLESNKMILHAESPQQADAIYKKWHPQNTWTKYPREADEKDIEKYPWFSENKAKILQYFEKHKGEFVITDSGTVERFIGLGDDEEDYYYVLFDGRKVRWQTCVGGLIWLKSKIDGKDYQRLVNCAKLNHLDQVDWYPTEEKQKLFEIKNDRDKYLTEIYTELV